MNAMTFFDMPGNNPARRRHTTEMVTETEDTTIIVIWDGNINPRSTTPLWAAVHKQPALDEDSDAAGARQHERVVIEVSARPPSTRLKCDEPHHDFNDRPL
jgi:hypothetical protein